MPTRDQRALVLPFLNADTLLWIYRAAPESRLPLRQLLLRSLEPPSTSELEYFGEVGREPRAYSYQPASPPAGLRHLLLCPPTSTRS